MGGLARRFRRTMVGGAVVIVGLAIGHFVRRRIEEETDAAVLRHVHQLSFIGPSCPDGGGCEPPKVCVAPTGYAGPPGRYSCEMPCDRNSNCPKALDCTIVEAGWDRAPFGVCLPEIGNDER